MKNWLPILRLHCALRKFSPLALIAGMIIRLVGGNNFIYIPESLNFVMGHGSLNNNV